MSMCLKLFPPSRYPTSQFANNWFHLFIHWHIHTVKESLYRFKLVQELLNMHISNKNRDIKLQLEIKRFGSKGPLMIVLIPEFFNLSYINLVFSREVLENGWQFRMSSSGEIVPLGELGYKAGLARCRTRAPPMIYKEHATPLVVVGVDSSGRHPYLQLWELASRREREREKASSLYSKFTTVVRKAGTSRSTLPTRQPLSSLATIAQVLLALIPLDVESHLDWKKLWNDEKFIPSAEPMHYGD